MKNALIWGASGGIGRALVQRLVADEWQVVAVSRHPDDLTDLTPHTVEADVTDTFKVQVAITEASQMVEEVNLWIYAAGDIMSDKVTDLQPDDWQRILDANLTGAYLTTHHSMPLLTADAHLFYLGAISERLKLPGLTAYVVAKAGLEIFGEVLAKEQRKRRITIVRPGAVETPLWDKMPMKLPPKVLSPDDVAQKIIEAYQEKHKGTLDIVP